jgi:threonine aldolase
MNFASDTTAPAHPHVIDALSRANHGLEASYGNDAVTARLRTLIARTFGTDDFDFWLTASGTASNALALSCFCPPTGAILCHAEAHIERDERGAPEFFTGGGKLRLLPGAGARIDEAALRAALSAIDHGFVHETPAYVLSLTNLTECGTLYTPDEIAHYARLAKKAGLSVHLDGARFGNALVSAGCDPSEMSWRAGVDVLTFGLTKTGAIGCEVILLFGSARTKFEELKARAKRSGHMPPKMRFLAAQAEAMLDGALWLRLSSYANAMALHLAGLFDDAGFRLAFPVKGNEVFVRLPEDVAAALQLAGVKFYAWPGGSYRFVTNWTTSEEDLESFKSLLG